MPQLYKKIKVAGKTVPLHRYIMECHLSRSLTDDEVVHHKNEDRFDNRIENLEVLSHQAHSEHHNQRYPREKLCVVCGTTYTPAPTKRARSRTCAKPCFIALAQRAARERSGIVEVNGALMKPCKPCGRKLPWTAEFFHAAHGTAAGLMSICKDCNRAKAAAAKCK